MAFKGFGIFIAVLLFLIVLGLAFYIGYPQLRARQQGLPPPPLNPFASNRNQAPYRTPAPAPGGIQGWVTDKWHALRSGRSASGGYESTAYGSRRTGHGPLDPDEAWDARVDHETGGYYEEQELGLQDPHGPYGGGGYGEVGVAGIEAGRGRSRSRQRELDARYDEEVHHGGGGATHNPFGDAAEASNMSLRSVSPRPAVDTAHAHHNSADRQAGSIDNSPTERRSMFKEDV